VVVVIEAGAEAGVVVCCAVVAPVVAANTSPMTVQKFSMDW